MRWGEDQSVDRYQNAAVQTVEKVQEFASVQCLDAT